MKKVLVRIKEDSPRHRGWTLALGTDTVEVLDARPVSATVSGITTEFYRADVAKLTQEQIDRMAIYIAGLFDLDEAEVAADIRGEHGLPILCDGTECTVEEDFI